MNNEHPSRSKSWLGSLMHCNSEKPIIPTHLTQNHPLASLFDPMNAKLVALNERNKLGDLDTDAFKPLVLHLNGDMSQNDYSSCSKLMSAFLEIIIDAIIQQTNASHIPITSTINSAELWAEAFGHFPFPVISGRKDVHHSYSKANFTLDEDKDFIEDMVGIKCIEGLADSVIEAVRETGQYLKQYSKQEKDFKYFGLIFGYFHEKICIRVIKFVMHMKDTDVVDLCDGKTPTSLNCEYDNHHFCGNTALILQVARKIQTPDTIMIENFIEATLGKQVRTLMTFLKQHFPLLLAHWLDKLTDIIKNNFNQIPDNFLDVKGGFLTRPESISSVDQKTEPNTEFIFKEKTQELPNKGQAGSPCQQLEVIVETDLLAEVGPSLIRPNKTQRGLCLEIVDEFWDAQSTGDQPISFNYMDGTHTEKEKSEDGITCRLDRQNSFIDQRGMTFVSYQLQDRSDSFACVLIQIPWKEEGGTFTYEVSEVKKAFKDSLDKQRIVKLVHSDV